MMQVISEATQINEAIENLISDAEDIISRAKYIQGLVKNWEKREQMMDSAKVTWKYIESPSPTPVINDVAVTGVLSKGVYSKDGQLIIKLANYLWPNHKNAFSLLKKKLPRNTYILVKAGVNELVGHFKYLSSFGFTHSQLRRAKKLVGGDLTEYKLYFINDHGSIVESNYNSSSQNFEFNKFI